MSDIEIHELGAAYALDALDPTERAAYEAHFANCSICRTDVDEHRRTAATLGELTSAPPPAGLKAQVLAQVATTRQLPPRVASVSRLTRRSQHRWAPTLAAAAAVLLVVVSAALVIDLRRESFGEQVAALMNDPAARVAELEGPAGSLKVVWDDARIAVIGDDLPAPDPGKTYELWLIDAAGAHAVGLLDPADDGTVRRMLKSPGEPQAWGITIEPAAGSATPTGPVLYQAEVRESSPTESS
jgi:anti-sigma-K factor RskA